jgi:hypothetical protein
MQGPTGTSSSEASLMPLIMGHMDSRVIFVAAKLNLADLIAEGYQTIAELADRTRTHAPSLERVLRTLGSLGVLDENEPGKLVLTPLGNQLRTGVSGSVRDLALMFGNERSWQSWGDLLHSVQTGESAAQRIYGMSGFEYFAANPEQAVIFNQAMAENTRRVGADIAAGYDFSDISTVVDIGGGSGALLAVILPAFPTLQGIVFDLPSGLEGARRCLEAAGVASRCAVVEGRAVPAGAGAYILKNVVHDWDDDRGVAILQSCRAAMPEQAKLLLIERLMPTRIAANPVHRQIALMDINMLVMPGGRQRTEPEFRVLLARSDFRWNATVPLSAASGYSIIEAIPV